MKTAKVLFISEEEKNAIDRLKKAYMATDSGKKKREQTNAIPYKITDNHLT